MTTATNLFYGTRIGYIAELSDGTYHKVMELNRIGFQVSKVVVRNLLENPITVAWNKPAFLSPCQEPMAKIILGTINSGLAGNSGVSQV